MFCVAFQMGFSKLWTPLGCCNKTGWPVTNTHLFLTVLQAVKFKIKVLAGQVSGKAYNS